MKKSTKHRIESIDRSAPVPLYEQIKNRLIAELSVGAGGDRGSLSDAAVMARFGVSRMTVRNAIADLVRDGILVRVPGRGTFIAPEPPLALHLDGVDRFMQDWHLPHLDPVARILTFRHHKASDEIAARLQIDRGSEILLVRRVRNAGGEPVAYDVRFVAGWCAGGITREDATRRSLFVTVESKSNFRAVAVEQRVGAVSAEEDVAKILQIPVRSPLLRREVTFFAAGDRPLLTGLSLYRSDRITFHMRGAR